MKEILSYFKKKEPEKPISNEKHQLTQSEIEDKIKEINNKIRGDADSQSYMSKDFFNLFSLRYSSNQKRNPSLFTKFLYGLVKVMMIFLLTIIGILFFILIGSLGISEEEQIKSLIYNLLILFFLLIGIWFFKNYIENNYL